jgi:hypothetical protein
MTKLNTNSESPSLASVSIADKQTIYTSPGVDDKSIDSLDTYYAVLNSRLTRLHSDVAGPNSIPSTTITTHYPGPARHTSAGVI